MSDEMTEDIMKLIMDDLKKSDKKLREYIEKDIGRMKQLQTKDKIIEKLKESNEFYARKKYDNFGIHLDQGKKAREIKKEVEQLEIMLEVEQLEKELK